ncbi:hypothetical protein PMM47T1_23732 [Pseudomonas sp. M47T1]|uniref:DUF4142 domain-containing protein n=1 Tax=unclassified Pseudomonas TaxID=196821 RepID=UPI0002607DD9|nr:DUF4142 domain-containing protein [Pseudomonas sp. M47T1]EIK94123.1 hypothetical protein PMM47T1_23732 [Pseudomonas sp. M47T1]
MDAFKAGKLALAIALTGVLAGPAFAATSNDFVDAAASGGITEVEAGKLALEKSTSADVKTFANQMIKDHGAANDKLTALATKLDIEVPDSATLTQQAKQKVLEMRDESFDKAYAANQVKAHEDTVALFKKEAASSDKPELKAFAEKTLPTLEEHLKMAKALQAKHM